MGEAVYFFFSVIIPIRNRWNELTSCLESLALQVQAPAFEVIVIDDGSAMAPPDSILLYRERFPMRLQRQDALGIAAARNNGLIQASGEVALFIDSDCLLNADCLNVLGESIRRHSRAAAFQLKVTGARERLLDRIEDLRLRSTQKMLETHDGEIRWVNTSAFALRRAYVEAGRFAFEDRVIRGEDTLLLVRLHEEGCWPRYVPKAVVRHCPRQALPRYLCRQLAIGFDDAPSRFRLDQGGIRLTASQRLKMACLMLRSSIKEYKSLLPFVLAMLAYGTALCGRMAYRLSTRNGARSGKKDSHR